MPQLLANTIPKLHRANTRAWGRLKCGRPLDTVSVHCDNRSEQFMSFLRYLKISFVWYLENSMFCSSFHPWVFLLPFPKKPTRVSRQGRPYHIRGGSASRL